MACLQPWSGTRAMEVRVMHYYCGLGDVVFLLRKFVCE
jgi:hypothetical protein